jgi:hypothetical protein
MKANKSKRNRHTGRINAYKARILDSVEAKIITDSAGTLYAVVQSGIRTHRGANGVVLNTVPVHSYVRASNVERFRPTA